MTRIEIQGMEKIEIKIGDQFLYVSKYGGTVIGEIAYIGHTTCYDCVNNVVYKKYRINSTKGVSYDLNEVKIIERTLTPEQSIAISEKMRMMKHSKEQFKLRHKETMDEAIRKHKAGELVFYNPMESDPIKFESIPNKD